MRVTRDQFRLSFFEGPKFHSTVSNKTGKRTVTCVLEGVLRQPETLDGTFRTLNSWNDDDVIRVSARAVCSANDTCHEKIGQAVAQAKAETKAYQKARLLIQKRIRDGFEMLQKAEAKFSVKASDVIMHNAQYLGTVTDPASDLYKRKTQTC